MKILDSEWTKYNIAIVFMISVIVLFGFVSSFDNGSGCYKINSSIIKIDSNKIYVVFEDGDREFISKIVEMNNVKGSLYKIEGRFPYHRLVRPNKRAPSDLDSFVFVGYDPKRGNFVSLKFDGGESRAYQISSGDAVAEARCTAI